MNTAMAILRSVLRRAAAPRAALAAAAGVRPFSASTSFAARVTHAAPIDPPAKGEMGVGELEGAEFKIQPLRRVGEDAKTMRARLVCKFSRASTDGEKSSTQIISLSLSMLSPTTDAHHPRQTNLASAAPSSPISCCRHSPTSTSPK